MDGLNAVIEQLQSLNAEFAADNDAAEVKAKARVVVWTRDASGRPVSHIEYRAAAPYTGDDREPDPREDRRSQYERDLHESGHSEKDFL